MRCQGGQTDWIWLTRCQVHGLSGGPDGLDLADRLPKRCTSRVKTHAINSCACPVVLADTDEEP